MFFNQRFNFDCGKGKGKVSTQAKRPSQPELILVSIAWSNWGYHCSPLDASPSQGYAAAAPPPFLLHFIRFLWQFASTHLYCWLERGTLKVKLFCRRTQHFDLARSWTQDSRLRVQCTNHWSILLPWMCRRGSFILHSIFMSVKPWQFQ